MTTIETEGGFLRVTGTEADICRLVAQRQAAGLAKYGTSLRDNPLTLRQWLQHALEENLDAAAYLLRSIEQLDREAMAKVPLQMSEADKSKLLINIQDEIAKHRAGQRIDTWQPYNGEDDGK